ncbi:hypothetical protein VD659_05045 [Herbiconiux sp. 11R-BC]|uniref:hypothetical protein n=1 Tax=Herbiconiux sp. 11R-BC TaxID=3111637 RepID=UPI003C08C36D
MFRKNAIRVATVGVIAAALLGAGMTAANAADEPVQTVGSKGKYYIADANDGSILAPGSTRGFEDALIGMPSNDPAQIEAVFPGSADSTQVKTFISARGQEQTPSAWIAWGDSSFKLGTHDMIYPTANLSAQISGNQATVKAGGNYSLGFAFMNNNGLNISADGVYYTYITVLPGTGGQWKFATPSDVVPPSTGGSFDVNLNATTLAAQDGGLSLVAPAAATAAIDNPTLVNGLSTSTGTLGEFSVIDQRYSLHPGWTLTTTVTPFTNSADSTKVIDQKQLGVAPTTTTPNSAVTLAAAQTAGSGVYPSVFAQADNTLAVGEVKLNAGLTFVSPANMPAGTYTSKLTLTLASK